MSKIDAAAVEERFRALESELGSLDLGAAILMMLSLGDEWANVLASEIRRCVNLYGEHYRRFEGPRTIRVGGGNVSDSRDELIAAIGFLQGVTFATALAQERKHA